MRILRKIMMQYWILCTLLNIKNMSFMLHEKQKINRWIYLHISCNCHFMFNMPMWYFFFIANSYDIFSHMFTYFWSNKSFRYFVQISAHKIAFQRMRKRGIFQLYSFKTIQVITKDTDIFKNHVGSKIKLLQLTIFFSRRVL